MEKFSGRIMSLILVVVVVITAYAAADGLLGDDETGIVISNSVLIIPAEESDGDTDNEALIATESETPAELHSESNDEIVPEAEQQIEAGVTDESALAEEPKEVEDGIIEAAGNSVEGTIVQNTEKQPKLNTEIDETTEIASATSDASLSDEIPEETVNAENADNVNLEAEQITEGTNAEQQIASDASLSDEVPEETVNAENAENVNSEAEQAAEDANAEQQDADVEQTGENGVSVSLPMDVLYIEKETKVYEQNDINSDVIAVLPEGCEVPLIEDMGEWLRIALSPEKEGYINKVEEETEGSHEEEITEEITDVIIEANTEEIVEETSLENDSQGETVIDTDPYVEASEETIALKTSSEEIIRDETVEGTASPVFEEGNIVNEEDRYISIRLNPDGLSEIIAEAKADEIEVFSVDGDWALVICGDKVGYVYANDLGLIADGKVTEKKVTIFTSRRSVMEEGETVYLTSVVEGMDGIDFTYNWQWNRGNGWEDIPGANSDTYEFSADSDTLSYSWRLRIHYDDDTVTQLDNE